MLCAATRRPALYPSPERGIVVDATRFETVVRSLTQSPPSRRSFVRTLGAVAALTLTRSAGSSAKGQDKVTLCHNEQPITVAASAVPAHLEHGDLVGVCSCPSDCFHVITAEREAFCASFFNRGTLQACSSSGECTGGFFPTCATLDGDTGTGYYCTFFTEC
jgi:hypothetical protein